MPQLDTMVHKTFSVFAPELFAENVFSTDYAALAFLLRVRRPLHSKCVCASRIRFRRGGWSQVASMLDDCVLASQ